VAKTNTVLLTGGTGYIGSHVAVELAMSGHSVVLLDNLSNSRASVVDRIAQITCKPVQFIRLDMLDYEGLCAVFEQYNFDGVIHLAGMKAVGESVEKPLEYYRNNVGATINLARCCCKYNVVNIVFSSSATVYGTNANMPLCEDNDTGCVNPYGWTKLMSEQILRDVARSRKDCNIALLRYFNPIGAHSSGLIGECPNDIPSNLAPYVLKVASGQLPYVRVFGNDYDTVDGTGVRDYIHVVDLAKGHINALDKLNTNCGLVTYNLGRGKGYSVLEVIAAFERACGRKIPYKFVQRRAGDIAICYASVDKAREQLGWQAQYDIDQMAIDGWKWQQYYVKNLFSE